MFCSVWVTDAWNFFFPNWDSIVLCWQTQPSHIFQHLAQIVNCPFILIQVSIYTPLKKQSLHSYEGLVCDIIWYRPLWDFLNLIPHFPPQTINWPWLIWFMKNDSDWKPANCKDHARDNYKPCPPYMPVINPIDHWTAVPCLLKLAWVIQPYWSTGLCPGQFSKGYSIAARMAMLLSNYPCVILFMQHYCLHLIIFHKSMSNMIWPIYDLWRQIRYRNVNDKIPQWSVSIMSPYNNQIWNCDPSNYCRLSFLEVW